MHRQLFVAAAAAFASLPVLASLAPDGVRDAAPYFQAITVDRWAYLPEFTVQGPQLSWDCSGSGPCSFSGALQVSLVFDGFPPGFASSPGRQYLNGNLTLTQPLSFAIVSPKGETIGTYQADLRQWTYETYAHTDAAPAGASFVSAYGQHFLRVSTTSPDFSTSQDIEDTRFLVSGQASVFRFGDGPAGADAQRLPSANFLIHEELRPVWYAFPSKTDPYCASLSCMSFGGGSGEVTRHALVFELLQIAPGVPEPGTGALLLLGLGVAAFGRSSAARR